jgi:hypothetical protein
MKVKGNLDLLGNLLQNANLEAMTSWPAEDPGVGRLLLKQEGSIYRLYLSGGIESGLRIWIPLSQEMSMHIHDQASASCRSW